ncbi:MAG: glycoside hydrolase family 130 protein [Pirellulales bacterium]|nr:glycoside hydrolase family 130 protein [Pirellulales bacterium]
MPTPTIHSNALPNVPWEDRPAGCDDLLWRYGGNPVLPRNPMPGIQGIYNSAVVPFEGQFAGVFRTESKNRYPHLHAGRSRDGIHWEIESEPVVMTGDDPEVDHAAYAYDPRVVGIDDTYYVIWCSGHNGPTIGLAATKDFRRFGRLENAFLPFNRNGVLFPRKVGGHYLMLSRPSDDGHTPFGDIYLSESPDLCHWGRHRRVMGRGGDAQGQWWQRTKIGAGPAPIETSEGWLLIYHGVMDTCNGFVYSVGAALLDLERPWQVLYRTDRHLMTPEADYETCGHVPNVVFPCAALCDGPSGRIALYYGAADTCSCLAFCRADELIAFTKAHSQVF